MRINSIIFLIISFSILSNITFAQNELHLLNSLIKNKDLNHSIKLLDSISAIAQKKDPNMAMLFLDRQIELGKEFNNDSVIAKGYSGKSKIYRKNGDFESAEKFNHEASLLFKKYNNPIWEITMLADLGTIYMLRGIHDIAIQKYLDAIKIAEQHKINYQLSTLYANIGNVFIYRDDYENTIKYYQKAYDSFNSQGDTANAALILDNLGLVHEKKKNFDTALKYHLKALQTIQNMKNKTYLGECFANIGNAYAGLNDFSNAIFYLKKSEEVYDHIQYKYGKASVYINVGDVYRKQKKFKDALDELNKGYQVSKELNSFELMKTYAYTISQTYEEMGDPKNSLIFYKTYNELKDSIFNIESTQQINELTQRFESKQKQNEIDLLTKDKLLADSKIKQSKTISGFLISGILLTIILLATLYYRYRDKQKANTLLEEKNQAIHEQKKLLEEKQTEIIDSINYAKKLQGAILLNEEDLKKQFDDIFVLYKPKDIVSGDFYWFSESDQNKILAVADCTGHGVPGGFMSMLGYESLQDVALRKEIQTTSQALTSLDKKITESLNKSDRTFRDGMDIALIAINKTNKKIQFSGANRPLIQIRNGELIEHKPDKQAIGGNIDNAIRSYNTINITCEKGDLFYMFTDGYADQFGGMDEKKFKYKNLLAVLKNNHQLTLSEQKQALDTIFTDWKGKLEQLDDVCIIGFKI